MTNFENNFFLYTNPLLWLYFIVLSIWYVVRMFLDYVGIIDWYFVLFKLRRALKNDENLAESLKYVNENRTYKLFWLKQLAWNKAVKIIESEIQNT